MRRLSALHGASDETGFVQFPGIGFFARARVPLVLQSEAAECSLACIAMLAAYHRNFVSLPELRLLRP
ncbi:MAG: cysteine peptidase family C39 domain-containing protein, partial [Woeseiaceae bacterium]